ncbi:MAG: acyltransferase domain-containing protein, partial [Myxococcota bacterium]
MSVWMFPGQGSQHVGMGENLFALYDDWVQQADATLGYSIVQLCLQDSQHQLNQTQYTQPALYVVNAMAYRKRAEEGQLPQWLLGHSLGEYNALLAADAYNFVTGLQLVQKRGALMSQQQGGCMAVALGLKEQDVQQALQQGGLHDVDIANINAPEQIVVAGPQQSVKDACEILTKAGAKRMVTLPVSGAFHSRYMRQTQ